MAKSRGSNNQEERFFAAVTINCKTTVNIREKAVKEEIAQSGVKKKNVALFKCYFNGINTNKKLTHKPRFPFMSRHRTALENACSNFLEGRIRA